LSSSAEARKQRSPEFNKKRNQPSLNEVLQTISKTRFINNRDQGNKELRLAPQPLIAQHPGTQRNDA